MPFVSPGWGGGGGQGVAIAGAESGGILDGVFVMVET
jgi:hypothetical protein